MGNEAAIRVGAGRLLWAPVGTAEPTDLTTAWNASWTDVGYTDEGHTFTQTPTLENIPVEEEQLPARIVKNGLDLSVQFACAELVARKLQIAFNGGTITPGTGFSTFTPPSGSDPIVNIAIAWESDTKDERWIFRKCIQTGASEITRRRVAKATVPMAFSLQVVSGKAPFVAIVSNAEPAV